MVQQIILTFQQILEKPCLGCFPEGAAWASIGEPLMEKTEREVRLVPLLCRLQSLIILTSSITAAVRFGCMAEKEHWRDQRTKMLTWWDHTLWMNHNRKIIQTFLIKSSRISGLIKIRKFQSYGCCKCLANQCTSCVKDHQRRQIWSQSFEQIWNLKKNQMLLLIKDMTCHMMFMRARLLHIWRAPA